MGVTSIVASIMGMGVSSIVAISMRVGSLVDSNKVDSSSKVVMDNQLVLNRM